MKRYECEHPKKYRLKFGNYRACVKCGMEWTDNSRVAEKIKAEITTWLNQVFSVIPGHIGSILRKKRYGFPFNTGIGCQFIDPQNMRFGNVSIGNNVYFTTEGGGRIVVDDHTTINNGVHINAATGGVIHIGKSCMIGPGVLMRTATHKDGRPAKDIMIGDGVWIGGNAVVLGGSVVGAGATIGAGSVVTKAIPPGSTAIGVPAAVLEE